MKRLLFIICIMIFQSQLFAQFSNAEVGIIGLTCSQCSRSVEMAMKKLPFVKTIDMDLESTTVLVQFSNKHPIDFKKLAQSVRDAGFDVERILATYHYHPKSAMQPIELCIKENDQLYYPINTGTIKNNTIKILLLDKKMVDKTILKNYKIQIETKGIPCDDKAAFAIPYYIVE
ncbi:MAG TPA: heavy metal-associated domain-containing protein [Edaphocola sp.]|nr:heavy metal-associated domain-containing protein [Edaphocola sp.]